MKQPYNTTMTYNTALYLRLSRDDELQGESEIEIEDKTFFGKLIAVIEGKATVDPVCDCQPIYNVGIDKYTFSLHTHGITISSPIGKNLKGINIFAVECTEEEINEMFDILDSVN